MTGYVHLYGREAELQLVIPLATLAICGIVFPNLRHGSILQGVKLQAKRISDFEKRHQDALSRMPQETQKAYQARRKQASAVPGGYQVLLQQIVKSLHSFWHHLTSEMQNRLP